MVPEAYTPPVPASRALPRRRRDSGRRRHQTFLEYPSQRPLRAYGVSLHLSGQKPAPFGPKWRHGREKRFAHGPGRIRLFARPTGEKTCTFRTEVAPRARKAVCPRAGTDTLVCQTDRREQSFGTTKNTRT